MDPSSQGSRSPSGYVTPERRWSRSNVARTQRARTRLLVAAVDVLVERGYAATTVAAVQERAGASRGAVLHHFPTKAQLLVAAVEYVADVQLDELDERAARYSFVDGRPVEERLAIWLELTWTCFASRLFKAVFELWVASRTDPELREHVVPHERRLGSRLRVLAEQMIPELTSHDRYASVYDATLVYYRGLAVSELIGVTAPDQERLRNLWVTLASARPEAH